MVNFGTQASVHDSDHYDVYRILGAFPESYTTGSCARAMAADNRETKGLITPPR